ncbi:diaminopimelate decarboxylase [Acutalibacter sp.]|uniref:diaminopimelate decarboxylase n=1 Tax=Acutalibacter sp. TaxID=1918636 RepID=UPI0034DF13E5
MVNLYTPCLSINEKGYLAISGCDAVELARQYGTPLYVMSEDEIRRVCRSYVESFQNFYGGNGRPIYASKAFSCKEMCRIVTSEGLDVEVVSGGELYTALEAGVSGKHIHFQGNNKSCSELAFAVDSAVGNIVVDNLQELRRLDRIAGEKGAVQPVSLRVKPGIDAHTHEFIRTGQVDSKFGLDLASGEAFQAAKLAVQAEHLRLIGLHCHIGSQIMEKEPFVHAAEVMLGLLRQIKEELGLELDHLNLGGGFGIHYKETDDFIPYNEYMEAVSAKIHEKCAAFGLKLPQIYIEPGRSIAGEAGITLYTVGAIKEIPGVRNYVSIDGGMFENPRYALYQADYTCLLANKASQPADYIATIAGKCCESGDLIQEHTPVQRPEEGDILAVLSTGAYNYSMSSNYNRNLRPPCVMVREGQSRVVIKGETYQDLIRNDM